ncbi:hypothetical protein [Moraxella bovis]|uniref:hypothetical protein n=1 Tax=Moraxella bovis TaxID=476 RepID=UPI002227C976|nr:hypothetical protein [Moraxella bovis]UZA37024.1 hypothetical protein LP101_07435 [Moraxella bovis]
MSIQYETQLFSTLHPKNLQMMTLVVWCYYQWAWGDRYNFFIKSVFKWYAY